MAFYKQEFAEISKEGQLFESWAQRLAMEGLPYHLIELVKQAEFEAWVQQEHHKTGNGLFYSEDFRDLPPRFQKKILKIAYEISKEYCSPSEFLPQLVGNKEVPYNCIKDISKDSKDNNKSIKNNKNTDQIEYEKQFQNFSKKAQQGHDPKNNEPMPHLELQQMSNKMKMTVLYIAFKVSKGNINFEELCQLAGETKEVKNYIKNLFKDANNEHLAVHETSGQTKVLSAGKDQNFSQGRSSRTKGFSIVKSNSTSLGTKTIGYKKNFTNHDDHLYTTSKSDNDASLPKYKNFEKPVSNVASISKSKFTNKNNITQKETFTSDYKNSDPNKYSPTSIHSRNSQANSGFFQEADLVETLKEIGNRQKVSCSAQKHTMTRSKFIDILVKEKVKDICFWKEKLTFIIGHEGFKVNFYFEDSNILRLLFDNTNDVDKAIHDLESEGSRTDLPILRVLKPKDKKSFVSNSLLDNQGSIAVLYQRYVELHMDKISALNIDIIDVQKGGSENSVILDVLRDKMASLTLMLKIFENYYEQLKKELSSSDTANCSKLHKYLRQECNCFDACLPIYSMKDQILHQVQNNQLTIIVANTGSGKSTQIVQYLYRAGYADDVNKIIVCTQPRKVAAISICQYISGQIGSAPGELVGYDVGLKKKFSKFTKIVFMTDAVLLRKWSNKEFIENIACIVVDEVHERSLSTDLLLGVFKKFLISTAKTNLKMVVTSATIDPEVFLKFFGASSKVVVRVPGKIYPVKVVYEDVDAYVGWNYMEACVNKAYDIHCNAPDGAILVFLTSPLETEEAAQKLTVLLRSSKKTSLDAIIACLHGKLDTADQMKIFDPTPGKSRKIIFATNSAETSVTIPDVRYVIDSGMSKQMQYDREKNRSTLLVNFVSGSAANQRKGRAGRTQPGVCYRMYSKTIYDNMAEFCEPEILRMPLQKALLSIMDLKIQPDAFDFVSPIPTSSLKDAMYSLRHLGAIKGNTLTDLGRKIARLSLGPQLAKLVIEGNNAGIGYEAIIISALINVSNRVFVRTEENKIDSDREKLNFCNVNGDVYTFLSVYHEWINLPDDYRRLKWCDRYFINNKAMEIAQTVVCEIMMTLKDMNISVPKKFQSAEFFHRTFEPILFDCFSENLFVSSGEGHIGYISPFLDGSFHIHPSSSLSYLHEHQHQFVVCMLVLKTSRSFLVDVTPVSEQTIVNAHQNNKFDFPIDILKSLKVTPTIIKPVGEVILLHHVLGSDGSIIKNIERSVKCLYAGTTFHIDVLVKKGEIIIHSDYQCGKHISVIVKEAVDKGRKVLSFEEKTCSYSQNFCYALGCGGLINDIIFPGESKEVIVQQVGKYFNVKAILNRLSDYGEIINHVMVDDSSLSVTFKEVVSAKCVLKYFNADRFDVNVIRGKIPLSLMRKEERVFEFKVEWPRLVCNGTGTIKFVDSLSLIEASYKFIQSPFFVEKNYIIAKPPKGKEDELTLYNLPKHAEENKIRTDIVRHLQQHIEVKSVTLNCEQPHLSSQREIETQTSKLKQAMSHFASTKNMSIEVEYPSKFDTHWTAIVSFNNVNDGEMVKENIKNGIMVGPHLAKVSIISSAFLYCKSLIYEVLEDSFKECEKKYQRLDSSSKITITKGRNVIINVSCNDTRHFSEFRKEVTFLLEGKHILCSLYPKLMKLFTQRSRVSFRDVEKSTKTVIYLDTLKKIITIYGSERSIQQAKQHITNMNLASNIKKTKVFDLNSKRIPPGFTKLLYKMYGYNLSVLIKEYCLNIAYFDFSKRQLVLGGLLEHINKAEDHLEDLCTKLFEKASSSNEVDTEEVETCPICLDKVLSEESIRLENCGHSMCTLCLQLQIKSEVFPVVCSKENCGEPFFIADFRKLFQRQSELASSFGDAALKHFLKQNIYKIRNCPTPNCSMIYRVESDAVTCRDCQNIICTKCHSLFHFGMSCEMFKSTSVDEDYPLKVWQNEDPANRKSCPACKTPIEKLGGCSHVTCLGCDQHMCWNCLAVFPEDKQVYDHLESCPAIH